jgi:hypothetical protein
MILNYESVFFVIVTKFKKMLDNSPNSFNGRDLSECHLLTLKSYIELIMRLYEVILHLH